MITKKKQLLENMVRRIIKEEKEFSIKKTRYGRESIISGTMDYLIDYFSYTLEKGNSWDKKVIKDPTKLRSMKIEKFIHNLNRAKDASTGNGYDASTDYDVV